MCKASTHPHETPTKIPPPIPPPAFLQDNLPAFICEGQKRIPHSRGAGLENVFVKEVKRGRTLMSVAELSRCVCV